MADSALEPWQSETLELAAALIRQDTANPPGNEWRAAAVLKDYLTAAGIDVEVVESAEGRASVIARTRADAGDTPGLLLSHLDVSPVQPDFWSVDPFGGTVADGFLWGRGAIDLKSLAAAHAVGLAAAARNGTLPDRPIVMLSVADETRGGSAGIRWLEANRPAALDVAWVLGEGSFSYQTLLGSSVPVFTFCPEEKTALWLELSAVGQGGHSSVPRGNTAVERLVEALARVSRRPKSVRVVDNAERFLATFAEHRTTPAARDTVLDEARSLPAFAAMFTDTVSITIVEAGFEPSVVPSLARAVLDCRLLPDTDPDRFISDLGELLDGLDVEIRESFRAVSGHSAVDGPVAVALADAIGAVSPGAIVAPVVSAGYTDLRIFRAMGIPAYGCHLAPITLTERATISGHDERVPAESLGVAASVVYEFLSRVP